MTIGRRWLQLLIVVLVASSMGQVSQCNPSEEEVERYFSSYRWIYTPQWTPDGQMLILGRTSSLYSLDTNTGELVALSVETSGPDILQVDYSPSLSPDGTRIAFMTTRFVTDGYYSYDIAVSDIDGRRAKQLTPSTAREINPSWSPDGSRIAFLSNRDTESRGSFNLFTMRDDGSHVVSVAPGIAMVDGPFAWSPDGEKLAFIGQIEHIEGNTYRFSLYIARADGSGTEFVWDGFEGFIRPSIAVFPLMAWSPDGSQVAISNPHHGTYVIDATDAIPRRLADVQVPLGLFWTSDGEEVLYFSKGVIHAIPVDGGTPYVRLDLVDQRRSGGFMDGTLYVSASPDRTKLAAYSNPRVNVASLGIIDLDGSVTQLIEASDWPDYIPDFN